MTHVLYWQELRPEAIGCQGIDSARFVNSGEFLMWVCTPSNPFEIVHRLNPKTHAEVMIIRAHRLRLSKQVCKPLPLPAMKLTPLWIFFNVPH